MTVIRQDLPRSNKLLSHVDLEKALDSGEIIITPVIEKEAMQPASIDLRIGDMFMTSVDGAFDAFDMQEFKEKFNIEDRDLGFMIEPKEFVLAQTLERVVVPTTMAARVEGKSSLGRMGLFVHVTAGFVDPGWDGVLTLELFNASTRSIFIPKHSYISQICFYRLDTEAIRGYSGKYQYAKTAEASKL